MAAMIRQKSLQTHTTYTKKNNLFTKNKNSNTGNISKQRTVFRGNSLSLNPFQQLDQTEMDQESLEAMQQLEGNSRYGILAQQMLDQLEQRNYLGAYSTQQEIAQIPEYQRFINTSFGRQILVTTDIVRRLDISQLTSVFNNISDNPASAELAQDLLSQSLPRRQANSDIGAEIAQRVLQEQDGVNQVRLLVNLRIE